MQISFSECELSEIRLMAETAYGSHIGGIQMTYGENIEKIICDGGTRSQIDLLTVQNYIEQLKLEKQFYWSCGIDEMPLIDKVIAFFEEVIEEQKNCRPY